MCLDMQIGRSHQAVLRQFLGVLTSTTLLLSPMRTSRPSRLPLLSTPPLLVYLVWVPQFSRNKCFLNCLLLSLPCPSSTGAAPQPALFLVAPPGWLGAAGRVEHASWCSCTLRSLPRLLALTGRSTSLSHELFHPWEWPFQTSGLGLL